MGKEYSYDEFVRLQQHRSRGLDAATELFGSITDLIEQYLQRKQPVRILELGFGFGMLLFELTKIYGDKIELVGINKREADGNWDLTIKSAIHKGIIKEEDVSGVIIPRLLYYDINKGIPLPNDSFDIIISQVCIFNVTQKAFCIEEANRVLDKDGVALLDLMVIRSELNEAHNISLSVLEEGKKVTFWEYAERFSNLKRKKNMRRNFLYLKKSAKFCLSLDFVDSFDLSELYPDLKGITTVYRIKV